jgi:hypothetical protein
MSPRRIYLLGLLVVSKLMLVVAGVLHREMNRQLAKLVALP